MSSSTTILAPTTVPQCQYVLNSNVNNTTNNNTSANKPQQQRQYVLNSQVGSSNNNNTQPSLAVANTTKQPATATSANKPRQYVLNNSATATTTKLTSNNTSTKSDTKVHCINPSCRSTDIIEETSQGYYICSSCGFVQSRIIDEGTEWRTFADDGSKGGADPSRIGRVEDELLAELGFGTTISRSSNPNERSGILAHTQHNEMIDTEHKYLLLGFDKCYNISNQLGLSKVIIDRSKAIFKRCCDSSLFKQNNRNIDGVICACIMISCRQLDAGRTIKEICQIGKVSAKQVFNFMEKIRQNKLHKNIMLDSSTTSTNSSNGAYDIQQIDNMIQRYLSVLALGKPELIKIARHICERAVQLDELRGRALASIASGAIYMTTQLYPQYNRDIQAVAAVCYISVNTVAKAYNDLCARRYDVIQDNNVNKQQIDSLKPIKVQS